MQGRSSRGQAELGRVQGYAPCVRTQRVLWRPGESQLRCSRGACERRIGRQPDEDQDLKKSLEPLEVRGLHQISPQRLTGLVVQLFFHLDEWRRRCNAPVEKPKLV